VNSASEVLTPAARELATRAWGAAPFDVYAATETGGIAAECAHHTGLHLFEDLIIAEPVDGDYCPVPAGATGARLLVTVLSSRTLPLIRFELTDRVRLSTAGCPCGLPFRLMDSVEGRTDDVLSLPAAGGGTVPVHPVAFHRMLDLLDAAGWQVRQDDDGQLTVLVAAPGADVKPARLAADVTGTLAAAALPRRYGFGLSTPSRPVRAASTLSWSPAAGPLVRGRRRGSEPTAAHPRCAPPLPEPRRAPERADGSCRTVTRAMTSGTSAWRRARRPSVP